MHGSLQILAMAEIKVRPIDACIHCTIGCKFICSQAADEIARFFNAIKY